MNDIYGAFRELLKDHFYNLWVDNIGNNIYLYSGDYFSDGPIYVVRINVEPDKFVIYYTDTDKNFRSCDYNEFGDLIVIDILEHFNKLRDQKPSCA